MFYNANMALAGLSLFPPRAYISRHNRLVDEDFDPTPRRRLLPVHADMTIIFLISVAVAASSASASQYIYPLLIPNSLILERMHKKERQKAAG